MVDHTLLKQTATWPEIQNLCDEAIAYGTASVCIPPCYVAQAHQYVQGKMTICTVVGFPNGNTTPASKEFETREALANGAEEIDMVINIGMLKAGDLSYVADEIRRLKAAVGDKVLKVIIETCLLTDEEKIAMCKVVTDTGADFIKTSTGKQQPAATPEATIQPTEEPAATEIPNANSAGNALAEGNAMTFGDVNETVTAKDVINLRSTPYTGDEGNVVGQLKNGETLVRTGRNDSTGWARLEYNGQTGYAVTAYLTTDLAYKTPEKPSNPNRVSTQDGRVIVFVDCDDYITPKDLINLRTEPSTSEGESTVRTQVRNGTNLHRTGYSEASGWSRVEYNGEILYAVTNYVISGSAPE